MSMIEQEQSVDLAREDARALQQRLCREIGLAAVADALGLPRSIPPQAAPRPNPAILVLQVEAA